MKSKKQKRIEAEVRQEEYAALTDAEKWARINGAPGEAARQSNRLLASERKASNN